MSMEWFRWWHGSVSDPKFRVIARKADVSIAVVVGVWAALLEHASQHAERGSLASLDLEDTAEVLGIPETTIQTVIDHMTAKGLITGAPGIAAWSRRQPKREDDSNARVKACRERQKATVTDEHPMGDETSASAGERNVTPSNAEVTQSNAPEKIREDPETDPEPDVEPDTTNALAANPSAGSTKGVWGNPTASAGAATDKTPYPSEFETAWALYPKRDGDNPKRRAYRAWQARRRSGVTADALIDGTRRYAAFCAATGKVGTPFVKQAATFFGPDESFREPWTVPRRGAAARLVMSAAGMDTLAAANRLLERDGLAPLTLSVTH